MEQRMHIRQLAEKLRTSPRAIRFYEEKGLISPEKDPHNRYRLFSERDAWRLQTILALREVGMPVRAVKRVLEVMDKGENSGVRRYLELQRSAMFFEWIRLREMIVTLDGMIDSLENRTPDWEDIYRLTERSKRQRDRRLKWRDRWNFDRQAASYDQRVSRGAEGFDVHRDYDTALDETLRVIDPQPGEKGLDLGTGTGNLAGRFLAAGAEMAGVDQSWEMLRRCREKHPQMVTRLGNLLAIPFFDQSFDFVVTSYALHHLEEDQKPLALEEMHRVLKPGGRICIADLMFNSEEARRDYLRDLSRAGKEYAIAMIEDEYYADRSRLLAWFEARGYRTEARQINEILHLVCAVHPG